MIGLCRTAAHAYASASQENNGDIGKEGEGGAGLFYTD